MLVNIYHRSIYKANNNPVSFTNYASNIYNAYTDFYLPVHGQGGVRFLNLIATLGEFGVRVNLGNKNYLTPRMQVLLQFDKWNHIDFSNLEWSAGLTHQTKSKVGPIDFTLGFKEKFKDVNFYGGVGYQF